MKSPNTLDIIWLIVLCILIAGVPAFAYFKARLERYKKESKEKTLHKNQF